MKSILKILFVGILIVSVASCASKQGPEEELPIEGGPMDDLSELEGSDAPASGEGDEFALEEEPTPADTQTKADDQVAEATAQEPTEALPPPTDEVAPPPVAEATELPPPPAELPVPSVPEQSTPMAENAKPISITGIRFKPNEAGGSVVIESAAPVQYSTRLNSELNQFIVEIENATLPDRLKRSINTKDISGNVGAIDAYQSPGSSVARIVVQLRQNATEPAVQQEGNSLVLVYSSPTKEGEGVATVVDSGPSDVLPVAKLEEYLVGNTKFFGKKISIEMNNMDVRDALQFIMDETGMNMVISDKVDGKVSLKLKQVPWDQALVIIMKTRSLGYTRQGNVLRIATLDELRKEEEEAIKLAAERSKADPLLVRMYPVSYANVVDLEKKLKDFMSERGKVVADTRSNAVVVTETDENLQRISKIIENLDIRPPQVLIEGKIVEAKETFTRAVGVRWSGSGTDIKLGQTRRGPVNMRPSIGVNPSLAPGGSNLNLNLAIGTLDIFGNLDAALALREREEQVKVISSPRAMVLTNETAVIAQTQEVPIRQINATASGTVETIQFKPLALKMEVTPQITADASIILKVAVQRQIRGPDVGSGTAATFSVDSREANTRVLVQNGQTAVIGGIYNNETTSGKEGVPWFKDLPLVGGLFRTSTEDRVKNELLVFITPRIVGGPASSQPTTGGL